MNTLKKWWNELAERWSAPLNTWWRRWLKFWIAVFGIAAGADVVASQIIVNGEKLLPEYVLHILSHLQWISPVAAFIAKTAKDEFAELGVTKEEVKEMKAKKEESPFPDNPDTEKPFPENPPISNNDFTNNDITNPLAPVGEVVDTGVPAFPQDDSLAVSPYFTEEKEAPLFLYPEDAEEKNIEESSDLRIYSYENNVRWRKKQ